MSDEQRKRPSDYAREISQEYERIETQRQIDALFLATLECSGLIETGKPRRRQRRNRGREEWVNALFLMAAAEAEGR
jgi:hypothetical protein